jgi:hypothetical protein
MRKTDSIVLVGVLLLSAAGCSNIGNAPAGASIAQMKASFDAKPIEVRAKEINDMSIPEGDKQQTIKAMYAKEGKEAPADLLGSSGSKGPATSH